MTEAVSQEYEMIGACMHYPSLIDSVADLPHEAFYDLRLGNTWRAITALRDGQHPITAGSIAAIIKYQGLEPNTEAIQDCVTAAISGVDYTETVPALAARIHEGYRRRGVENTLNAALLKLRNDPQASIDEVLDGIEDGANQAFGITRSTCAMAGALAPEAAQRLRGLIDYPSLTTGMPVVDEMLGSMRRGGLYVIAGRTSHGKTSFGLNILRSICARGDSAVAFSLEMDKSQFADVLLKIESGVGDARGNPVADIRVGAAVESMAEWRLLIDDKSCPSLGHIKRMVSRKSREWGGVDVVLVDYLQLMRGEAGPEVPRHLEIAKITGGLKALARETSSVVIALSQCNRASEEGKGRAPGLHNLRESGSIEQDADGVIFVHRPDMADSDEGPTGEAHIILGKHRHGAIGKRLMKFQGKTQRFVEWI